MASTSANSAATSRFSWNAMQMKCVSVSARGLVMFANTARARASSSSDALFVFFGISSSPRITVSRNFPSRLVSSAVTQNSPSPCAACPSPALNSAPSTFTLKNNTEPAPRSLSSRFPPCAPGATEETTPLSGAGATPICPKNGEVASTAPPAGQGSVEVIVSRSMGTTNVPPLCASKPYARDTPSAPLPSRMAFQPQGTHGVADKTSTRSTSPGFAPRTFTGPVMMCGPGFPQCGRGGERCGCVPSSAPHASRHTALSSLGTSHASSGTPPGSPLTVHMCTTSPLSTSKTCGCAALHPPKCVVFGPARSSCSAARATATHPARIASASAAPKAPTRRAMCG
mmetsp:Transcript_3297/g.13850  ORF Transcript_3297/g.13850 Transcript_3297/m.13850 type:complete len:342 (-) Transcript_3297:31-1056(-)